MKLKRYLVLLLGFGILSSVGVLRSQGREEGAASRKELPLRIEEVESLMKNFTNLADLKEIKEKLAVLKKTVDRTPLSMPSIVFELQKLGKIYEQYGPKIVRRFTINIKVGQAGYEGILQEAQRKGADMKEVKRLQREMRVIGKSVGTILNNFSAVFGKFIQAPWAHEALTGWQAILKVRKQAERAVKMLRERLERDLSQEEAFRQLPMRLGL